MCTLRRSRNIQIFYIFASANSLIWTQETISLVQKMPITAVAVSGLAFFCSGVFYNMTKEERIIENMTERHNSNLDKMEDRMNEYVEIMELEMATARTDGAKKRIQARIDKYVNWYEEMVQQAEDSFRDRLERRLKTRRENTQN